jgi:hypothetical protein
MDKYAQYTKAVRYTANGPVRMSTTSTKSTDYTWVYVLMLGLAIVAGIAFVFAISL